MLKQIFTLLSAFIVGLIAALVVVQNNSQIEMALSGKFISMLEKQWGIKITKESSRINFFTCSLYLKNGRIIDPSKKNCYWNFKQCKIHLSPIKFILKRKINLFICFDNVTATSYFSSTHIDISDHLHKILSQGVSNLKVNLKSIQVNNLDFHGIQNERNINLIVNGRFVARKLGVHKHKKYSWQETVKISNAQVCLDNKVVAKDISLNGILFVPRAGCDWNICLDSQIKNVPPIPKKIYTLGVGWSDTDKTVTIKNIDNTLNVVIKANNKFFDIKGNFDLNSAVNLTNYFYKLPSDFEFDSTVSGKCKVDAKFIPDKLNFCPNSKLEISDIRYGNFVDMGLSFNLMRSNDSEIILQTDFALAPGIKFSGVSQWKCGSKSGSCKFFNLHEIRPLKNDLVNLGYKNYIISSKNIVLTACMLEKNKFFGSYKFSVHDQEKDYIHNFSGNYKCDNENLHVNGNCNFDKYSFDIEFKPKFHFSNITYKSNSGTLINFVTTEKDELTLSGNISYSLIKTLLPASAKNILLEHDCLFGITVDQKNFNKLQGELTLRSGSFYIPESQNLIQNIKSNFEFMFPNGICLHDLKIGFFKGDITCPKAIIAFDKNLSVSFLHFPLNFNDLLVNYKKDMLGIIYGNLLIKSGINTERKIIGQIFLKKSLLKENIFAITDKHNFYGGWNSILPQFRDLDFDLKFITEQPIRAKTPTLETNAALNLRITHKNNKSSEILNIPQLTGTIKLYGGYIKVLKNKLMIDYGKIEFVSNQMNDPIIDLIAKNKINKYLVTLQASGSLQKPTILVESTPELTEEQVLSLLLSGSECYKLQTDLLALIEQNLHNVVLGSQKSLPESNKLLKNITRPLKYIQISPDFTDQSARGGIKGTLNINVNDQVKAQIQKNFNLQEDFSAQLEYMLSDDINVKAIKDQRGELGAEVELRLKF